ncbi:hypothetical protein [Mycobacterium sp. 1274756.6]|uniref:hypothetical protein n=1 Tax=Mycobacterium sp. 1274756.6 TaxID=1834076 RepID=UPI000802381C|nr:hypothetical protein [Mycobacterium sp. 1274756.6]OBJ72375.1 hypothetical protein A5643_05595 [Mycobacterium sp. 1274756.6]
MTNGCRYCHDDVDHCHGTVIDHPCRHSECTTDGCVDHHADRHVCTVECCDTGCRCAELVG